MVKKISSLLVSLLLMSIVVGQKGEEVSAASIDGIPSTYKNEINYLVDRSIIEGYPDGGFYGNEEVTREQAATMVGRALDLDGEKRTTTFPDVSRHSFASGYIQSAVEKKIITGYTDGTYKPKEIMTRGEMAYLISKAFNLSSTSNISYSDVSQSSNVYEPVDKLTTAGISQGYPGGYFKPNKTITRTEFALFIARGMNADFKVSQEKEENLKVIDEKVVTASSLNVRTGPSTTYSIVGKLSTGEDVSIYKKEGNWAYISSGNLKGYVSMSYLTDKPNTSKVVAIDPGHGGKDPGAVANGLVEKEVVLDVSLKVRKYLENAGINVVMTRESDWYPSLDGRVAIAKQNNADTFVSVHANAFLESANGVETFYYAAGLSDREYSSYMLAKFINERLVKAMDMSNRGVKNAGYRVIKANPLPAVLTEIGFLTNDEDSAKLKTTYYRDAAARSIALGVIDYYNWKE